MSYEAAVPVRLSSPVAVHESSAVESVTPVTLTFTTAYGRMVSGADAVVLLTTFEINDQGGNAVAPMT